MVKKILKNFVFAEKTAPLAQKIRQAKVHRETKETKIEGTFVLDGSGITKIDSPIGFLNHMLELFCFHGQFDLNLRAVGDVQVDPHHTIEDVGICLGQALHQSLGEKIGIQRYSCVYLPMDETLSRTVVDISGRFYHHFSAPCKESPLGQFPTEMVRHFFYSLANQAALTLHQEILYGDNDHHKVEALFKGFGWSLKEAAMVVSNALPSTKGKL